MSRFLSLTVVVSLFLFPAAYSSEKPLEVDEGFGSLKVRASAPYPEEVANDTQKHALAREAAIVRGQTALLTYVLAKRTHSKKTLAEAEIPSIELQREIRGYIQGARPSNTQFRKDECVVTLVLDKSHLKTILRKN